MNTAMPKLVRIAVAGGLSAVVVLAVAVPAGASTGVLADEQFKWFYWIGFLLAVSVLGLIAALGFGYYVKVIRPRMRGRRVQ